MHVHPDLARLDPHGIGKKRRPPGRARGIAGRTSSSSRAGTGQPLPLSTPARADRPGASRCCCRRRPGADTGEHDRSAPHLHQLAAARREIREGGGALLGHRLEVFLQHEGAMQTAHVLPAHLRGLAYWSTASSCRSAWCCDARRSDSRARRAPHRPRCGWRRTPPRGR